jgi:hypothetical protein
LSFDKISEKNLYSFTNTSHNHKQSEFADIDREELNKMLTLSFEENNIASDKNTKQQRNKIKRTHNSKNEDLINTNSKINSNINTNISYRLINSNLRSKEEDMLQSMSEEISLDSHKTDCEDTKSNYKFKVHITPLERFRLFQILKDYFVDYDLQNESEFFCKLFNGEFFNCQEKTTKLVKNHYMRRRVCYKLYKVFEKLV